MCSLISTFTSSIFDFVKRVNLRAVSKTTMERMATAGAFDDFVDSNRAVFFTPETIGKPAFLETVVRFGQSVQEGKNWGGTFRKTVSLRPLVSTLGLKN